MKKIYKTSIIILIITTILSFAYKVEATGIWNDAKDFLETGTKPGTFDESVQLFKKLGVNTNARFGKLVDFLWGIGLLAVFITTVTLGIRYMLVLPEEKSRVKAATTPYIIGTVIIFGATTIWKLIIVILDGSL